MVGAWPVGRVVPLVRSFVHAFVRSFVRSRSFDSKRALNWGLNCGVRVGCTAVQTLVVARDVNRRRVEGGVTHLRGAL